MNDYFDLSIAVAEEIKQSENYQKLIELKDKIDIELKELIDKFNTLKNKYSDASKYGSYYPGLKELRIELSKCKTELYTNPLVIEYKELEKKIQQELNDFNQALLSVVQEG